MGDLFLEKDLFNLVSLRIKNLEVEMYTRGNPNSLGPRERFDLVFLHTCAIFYWERSKKECKSLCESFRKKWIEDNLNPKEEGFDPATSRLSLQGKQKYYGEESLRISFKNSVFREKLPKIIDLEKYNPLRKFSISYITKTLVREPRAARIVLEPAITPFERRDLVINGQYQEGLVNLYCWNFINGFPNYDK